MRMLILALVVVGCAATKPPVESSSSSSAEHGSATHSAHGHHGDAGAHEAATSEEKAPEKPLADGLIRVRLRWQNHGIEPLMEVFHLPPGNLAKLWEMGTGANPGDMPIGEVIEGGDLDVAPGSKTRFVLVMRNPTDAPLYFFAAPHHVNPVQLSLGFKFKCLCINHAFDIPPGEIWYRVVELRMDEGFVGNGITIEHALIGLDEARKKEFELPR